jgi:hypothetical protein
MKTLNQVMKAYIVVTLALMCAFACSADPGDVGKVPDCQADVLCDIPASVNPPIHQAELYCCPSNTYCGQPGTNCEVGACCSAPPLGI